MLNIPERWVDPDHSGRLAAWLHINIYIYICIYICVYIYICINLHMYVKRSRALGEFGS